MKHILTLSSVAILAVLLSACGPDYEVWDVREIDATGWAYTAPVDYHFTITDTQQLYTLHLVVEHATDFFAQNFYLNITTEVPGGETITEAVSIQLADKFGQWFGDCDAESCTLDIPIQSRVYFQQPGDYRIGIEQYTRKEALTGIRRMTFGLERVKG